MTLTAKELDDAEATARDALEASKKLAGKALLALAGLDPGVTLDLVAAARDRDLLVQALENPAHEMSDANSFRATILALVAAARERDELLAKVTELEGDAERERQDAYEHGLMMREGPDELSDEAKAELQRTYDRVHASAYGEHDADVRALQCIITTLQDRLAVRSERLRDLEAAAPPDRADVVGLDVAVDDAAAIERGDRVK